jgi:hypothetical protein
MSSWGFPEEHLQISELQPEAIDEFKYKNRFGCKFPMGFRLFASYFARATAES